MEQVTTIGLDIAKNVFQLHGLDAAASGTKTIASRMLSLKAPSLGLD